MSLDNFFDYFPFVPISKNFIEQYIPKTNPSFVIIYIYILNLTMQNKPISLDDISLDLDILSSDILKALIYWQDKNLIKFTKQSDNIYLLDFLNINAPSKEIKQTEDNLFNKENQKIEELFRLAEKKLAKTLNYNEKQTLIKLYENYDLSAEILAILLTYCIEKGKNNFRYIEKVAIDWYENKIDTIEKAEAYIQFFDNDYKEIFEVFGIKYRAPAPIEKSFLNKWIFEYKMSIDMIKKACEKTILKTSSPNFQYADSILKSWYTKNIHNIKDIPKDSSFKKNSNQDKPVVKRSKFVNYEQSPIDYDILRRIEEKSLMGGSYKDE